MRLSARPYDLEMHAVSSKKFHYADGELVADASDLGFGAGTVPGERMFNDAADWGIAVRSAHTGRVVRFSLISENRNHDNEVVAWVYRPILADVKDCVKACTLRMLVIND